MNKKIKYLKSIIIFVGIVTLGVYIYSFLKLPYILNLTHGFNKSLTSYLVILLGITLIPFEYILFQSQKILGDIKKDCFFSFSPVKALINIKKGMFTILIVYLIAMSLIFINGLFSGITSIILISVILVISTIILCIEIFIEVLKKAIRIKKENDLTI